MISFAKVIEYEQTKEMEDKLLVHPLLYTAYRFAHKQLKDAFPEDERLDNVETTKPVHSINYQLPRTYFTNENTSYTFKLNEYAKMEEVPVTELFYLILDVFPRAAKVTFYKEDFGDSNKDIRLEVPLFGGKLTNRSTSYRFPDNMEAIKKNHQRDMSLYGDELWIDYMALYMALGNLWLEDISDKEVSSVDEYVSNLHSLTKSFLDDLKSIQMSREFFLRRYVAASNEARVSFSEFLQPEVESIEEYGLKLERDSYSRVRDFPWFSELKEGNSTFMLQPVNTKHPLEAEEFTWRNEEDWDEYRLEKVIRKPKDRIGLNDNWHAHVNHHNYRWLHFIRIGKLGKAAGQAILRASYPGVPR